jgi:hypothetical protein
MKSFSFLCATSVVAFADAKWNGLPPPTRMDFGAVTGKSIVTAADPVTVGSPFQEGAQGIKLYANSYYKAEVEGKAIPDLAGNQTLIGVAKKVADIPSFFWL